MTPAKRISQTNNQFIYQKISKNKKNNINFDLLNKNLYTCLTYFCEKWKQHLKAANFKYFNKELNKGLQFNLFGIDVIIDKNLNPYVLEINYNPSFQASKAIKDIRKLKKKMWKNIIYNFINHYNNTSSINPKNFIELNNNNIEKCINNNFESDDNDYSDSSDDSDSSDSSDYSDYSDSSDSIDSRDYRDNNDNNIFKEVNILSLFFSLKNKLKL